MNIEPCWYFWFDIESPRKDAHYSRLWTHISFYFGNRNWNEPNMRTLMIMYVFVSDIYLFGFKSLKVKTCTCECVSMPHKKTVNQVIVKISSVFMFNLIIFNGILNVSILHLFDIRQIARLNLNCRHYSLGIPSM